MTSNFFKIFYIFPLLTKRMFQKNPSYLASTARSAIEDLDRGMRPKELFIFILRSTIFAMNKRRSFTFLVSFASFALPFYVIWSFDAWHIVTACSFVYATANIMLLETKTKLEKQKKT